MSTSFLELVRSELGYIPAGIEAAFRQHFRVENDRQMALILAAQLNVRAWIRQYAEANL